MTPSQLTWGQRAILRTLSDMGPDGAYFTMTREVRLRAPAAAGAVTAALAGLVSDHHSLRTVLQHGDGGAILQRAEPAPALEIHPVPAAGKGRAADAAAWELKQQPFDLWRAIPVRAAMLTRGAMVDSVVLAASHLAVDAAAMDVLEADLSGRLASAGEPPSVRWQPVDQAAFEATSPAAEASRRAVERWCRMIADAPEVRQATPSRGAADRFQEWVIDTPQAAAAASRLAERARVSPASAVLAAWCLALDAIDGERDQVTVTLISGNRHRAREQSYVGPLAQDTLFRVGWGDGCEIDDLVTLVHKQALSAYSHGRYDPLSLDAALGTGALKVRTFFNHARRVRPGLAVPGVPAAGGQPQLRGQWPFLDLHRFLVMQEGPGYLRLRLLMDTCAPAQPGVPAVLTGLCEILTRAADGATLRELKALLR